MRDGIRQIQGHEATVGILAQTSVARFAEPPQPPHHCQPTLDPCPNPRLVAAARTLDIVDFTVLAGALVD